MCQERGDNLKTEGREIVDLFRDTAFDKTGKQVMNTLEKCLHWKFRKL